MTERRFPPPWTVERIHAGWRVLDANGVKLVYVYGAAPAYQSSQSGIMGEAQAEAVAAAVARLPGAADQHVPLPRPLAAPFHVEEKRHSFRVLDASGYHVAEVYFEDPQAGDLTWDEARRIAANIAKLGV